MFKVTFAFENGSTVEAFANAGDNLLEVARSANVAIDATSSKLSPALANASTVLPFSKAKVTLNIRQPPFSPRKSYSSSTCGVGS